MAELVIATGLRRRYGSGPSATEALRGVDLRIESGEYIAVIGRSGSGKSTLLNLLGLLDRPSEGTLALLDIDVSRTSSAERARLRNRHIGFVFQFHHLLPEFDVVENVLMPARITGVRMDRRLKARADELIEMLDLKAVAHKPSNNLSGGQKQRVAIARALVNAPELVLADEPTGNLDSESASGVRELFREVHRTVGTTFVIVTHDEEVAASAERRIVVADGRIVADEVLAAA